MTIFVFVIDTQDDFLIGHHRDQYRNEKPELLFHEILHLREPLVGSLAIFIMVLNKGGPV